MKTTKTSGGETLLNRGTKSTHGCYTDSPDYVPSNNPIVRMIEAIP